MPTDIDDALKATEAPYGFKADGSPRKRPVSPNLKQFNPDKEAQLPATAPDNLSEAQAQENQAHASRELKRLHKSLSNLGKKSIRKLSELLDDNDKRIRLQAAGVATRASLMGLAKDALGSGGGAEIHIHTTVVSSQPAQAVQALGPLAGHDQDGPRPTGKPVIITD